MSATVPGEIARLAELFASGGWKDLRVESAGVSVHLSADRDAAPLDAACAPALTQVPVPTAAQPAAAAGKPSALAEPAVSADWAEVRAPNLGTFYRSPKPGSAPFVEIGQKVDAQTEICLLEVMKLFTSVKAGVNGTIRKVCVEDGVLVESGQVLFLVEAD